MLREDGLEEARLIHCSDIIERNDRTQMQLFEVLLDTARIVSDKWLKDEWSLDSDPVFAATLDMVGPAADTKGVKLRDTIEEDLREESTNLIPRSESPHPILVLGDADRLQ